MASVSAWATTMDVRPSHGSGTGIEAHGKDRSGGIAFLLRDQDHLAALAGALGSELNAERAATADSEDQSHVSGVRVEVGAMAETGAGVGRGAMSGEARECTTHS